MTAIRDFPNDTLGNQGLVAPAYHAAVVTPSDDTDLAYAARSLLIGTAGVIKITTLGGETVTITVPAGVLPIFVTRVWAADLTADDIVALW